ncbi:hypothetical protein PoB_005514000 [Plakobranchus ocellatus]|uniref:Uncharacterized protein n=1 Tax=Plakobranchus ocellatus TaxID=259542 RepID=A0AAV4CB42_9GAST|nr:hypothetical protein PoB_005514000 [Plakobranchus ocellatus]
MERSWGWSPYRHHIAKHTSSFTRSPRTSYPRYDKAFLTSNQADLKLIYLYPGVVMGGTTLNQNIRLKGVIDRMYGLGYFYRLWTPVELNMPVPVQITLTGALTLLVTHSYRKRDFIGQVIT